MDSSFRKISLEEYLTQNGTLVYTFRGSSMRPVLRQDRDLVTIVRRDDSRCKKYDVVLFRSKDVSGKYILHRVIQVRPGGYVCRGDSCVTCERPDEDDVIGVLSEFHRGAMKARPGRIARKLIGTRTEHSSAKKRCSSEGHTVNVNDPGYRVYSRVWVASYPVRMAWRSVYGPARRLAGRCYHATFRRLANR